MDREDIEAILKVFSLPKTTVINTLNGLDILNMLCSLQRYRLITDDLYQQYMHKYSSQRFPDGRQLFLSFVRDICRIVHFGDFLDVLQESGMFELCKALEGQRCVTICGPAKQALPNDEKLVMEYTGLRKMMEDSRSNTGEELLSMISYLDSKIHGCQMTSRLQVLIDTRALVYYILAQKELNIPKRNMIMQKMRDVMPQDVDRTAFDAMFHSLKSINCAIQGNDISSDEHEKIAMQTKSSHSSLFLQIVTHFGSLYKYGVLFEKSGSPKYLTKAKDAFCQSMESTIEMKIEGRSIQRNVATLEHVRCLLGISLEAAASAITAISTEDIERARDILKLEEDQLTNRRKMKFLLCKGRLYELCDINKAVEYVRQALDLAVNELESRNIKSYMDYLKTKLQPQMLINQEHDAASPKMPSI